MQDAIKDRVRQGRITEILVPDGCGELTGDDGRAALIPVIQDFEQNSAPFCCRGIEPSVVEDQHLNFGELCQQLQIAAVPLRQDQFLQ